MSKMVNPSLDNSYPSPPITFADVPEVERFEARFQYNFFTRDESINDKGVELDRTDDDIERKIERSVPRLVRLNFKPVRVLPRLGTRQNLYRALDEPAGIIERQPSIADNYDKIRFEHELTSVPFAGVRFQDNQIDDKLYLITSGAVARNVERYNTGISNQFSSTEDWIQTILQRGNVNLYDAAKLLSTGKGDAEAQLIIKGLTELKQLNASFIDPEKQQERIDERFKRVRDVGIDVQINSKFVHHALQSITRDPFGLYADEVRPALLDARSQQTTAKSNSDPSTLDVEEYETFADPIRTRRTDVTSFDTRRRIIGYIIDKLEITANGQTFTHAPIIIQQSDANHAFDTNIAYNRRYVYTVRAIAEIEFIAYTEDNDDDLIAATILVSSKPSIRQIVDTVETVPPPPPADFNVDWDRTNTAARLTWSFPVNTQRDIKKWQIFRRKSIDEPFELIREYDFDDSIVKIQSGERPTPSLVHKVRSPINYYIDHEFDRTSKYMYAVCAVDAHGLSSNYSMQFEARYDQARNDIVKRQVSSSGAPKSYPNMYVTQEDIFVDVIRDSGHEQVDIYFDPEALDVLDASGTPIKFLNTDLMNGQYRLQLINTDLQQGDTLDILLRDLRRSQSTRNKTIVRNESYTRTFLGGV